MLAIAETAVNCGNFGLLPGQHVPIAVPKGTGILQGQFVNASEQAFDGGFWGDAALGEASHAGADQAGVQNRHGNVLRLEIMGQRLARHG